MLFNDLDVLAPPDLISLTRPHARVKTRLCNVD